jgi:hypothetical protein
MAGHCRWCITPQGSLAGSIKRVDRFRKGILHLGFGPVDVSEGIDWATDPFGTRMWKFRLHNLQWLYDLYRVAGEAGDIAAGAEANAVIEHWIAHNMDPSTAADMAWDSHVTALRARVIACSMMAFDGSFRDVLLEHARVIAPVALAEPAWNHGTDQLLTMLTVGCALGDDELIEQALGRLGETLVDIVDEQGVSNEQAPTYDFYVWSQLDELARLLKTCGLGEMPVLRRREGTPTFLAHATRPDGRWAHIGDTTPNRVNTIEGTALDYAVSAGQKGSAPAETVAIYDRGYVFGRSGWGTNRDFAAESWYSIRFGPGRRLHGHRDHSSFAWYAMGRPLVVEGGFGGYDDDEFRRYDRSEFAHNQVVATRAGDYDANATTTLANHGRGPGWESYLLRDNPYRGVERRRSLLVDHGTPFVVIRDDVASRSSEALAFTSLLHLPADAELSSQAGTSCIFDLPAETPMRLHASLFGVEGIEVFSEWGGTGGWVADGLLKRVAAPVLAGRVTVTHASIWTCLVPTSQLPVTVTESSDGLVVRVGDAVSRVVYEPTSGLLLHDAEVGSIWFPNLMKDDGRRGSRLRRWASRWSRRESTDG